MWPSRQGEDSLTPVFSCESEAIGRDREDQPDYKVRMSAAFCFSNTVQLLEYYHNSSWLEHGGSPETRASARPLLPDQQVSEGQEPLQKGRKRHQLSGRAGLPGVCVLQLLHPHQLREPDQKGHHQQVRVPGHDRLPQAPSGSLLPGKARGGREDLPAGADQQAEPRARRKDRQSIKKTLSTQIDLANRVQKFVDCRTKDASRRELYIVEGDSAMGAVKQSRDASFRPSCPSAARS